MSPTQTLSGRVERSLTRRYRLILLQVLRAANDDLPCQRIPGLRALRAESAFGVLPGIAGRLPFVV